MAATTAVELEPVANVTARLTRLLERAREVKPETTVEPALPVSSFIDDILALHEDFDDQYDQSYRFITVETAAREIFFSFVHSTDITDPAFGQVWNLLDLVLICGDHAKCTPELVAWLLEELLDSQTTHGCRIVFDYLDSRRERLAQKDFHKKNLVFLRSCNELLRRLSRAEDAIFCGRVFFFLFQTFPLGDKSSVNLRGEFHVENVTRFDATPPQNEDGREEEKMDVDPKPASSPQVPKESTPQPASGKPGSKAIPIKAPPKKTPEEEVLSSSQLYPIFWSLQHDFSDPTRLFEPTNFDGFKKALAATIAKFRKTSTVVQTRAGEEDKRGAKRRLSPTGARDDMVDNYNPKYLTSRDLFDLELSDLAFQRHILVQALILIDFLLSLTDKAKQRLAHVATPNKSLLHAFTLSDDDTAWATTTRTAITEKLGATSEGKLYHRMVETVLARDKNWVRWKITSCPSMVRGPVSTEDELRARAGASAAARPRRIPAHPQPGMDLDFLDEGQGGGLAALRDPARFAVPSLDDLVARVQVDKLDAEMADDDDAARLRDAMANAKWRALRQARAADLALLDKVESGAQDLEQMMAVNLAAAEEDDAAEGPGGEGDMGEVVGDASGGEAHGAVTAEDAPRMLSGSAAPPSAEAAAGQEMETE
jgi:THO complex subunit 1